MRVLRVLNELRPSGVEVGLRAAAALWTEQGVEVDILTLGDVPGPYADVLREAGYRIHHIPLRPFSAFARSYVRLLRSEGYDVVHVHPERASFYTAGIARLAGGAPVVRSIHNVFEFRGPLKVQRRLQRKLLAGMGVQHVSVSASVHEAELRNFSNPSSLIYNAYDERRFSPTSAEQRAVARRELGITDGEFVVVSVGNCSPVKNHGELIEALASVGSDLTVRYLHVGLEAEDGEERNRVRQLRLQDRVDFLGHRDPVVALRAADCFVMPSRWEGLGNAALEALACGVPSVLADVPGLRDLRDLVPGVRWVRPERADIARTLRAVRDLRPSERAALRDRLATAVRQRFRTERAVREYVELYRSAMGSRSAGGRPSRIAGLVHLRRSR